MLLVALFHPKTCCLNRHFYLEMYTITSNDCDNLLIMESVLSLFVCGLFIGVPFATPEVFFNGDKEGDYAMPEFQPKDALQNTELLQPSSAKVKSGSQEVIVMVGFPGSGKSYFSTKHLSSYQRINRDTLGSWQKCVAR